jgi:lariat debranching enzyme
MEPLTLLTKEGLRIAVEGCGHGTLNAIYASVKKSCELKDWDGVDLLIIGGDFQVRANMNLSETNVSD